MNRKAIVGAGLLLGLIAGLGDGISILRENPRSFESPGSSASFLGAVVAAALVVGAIGGVALAAVPRIAARLRPGGVFGGGLALGLFLWAGVRVHVRWFFGEPLLSPASLAANAGIAAASALLAWLVWRIAGKGVVRLLGSPTFAIVAVGFLALSAVTWFVFAPRRPPIVVTGAPPETARDVLLVTLDTTRADHLSSFGYPRGTTPAIDRLARTGVSLNLYAPIPLTNPSHVSMLTGLPPREHGVLNNGTALAPEIPTVTRDLARRGWNCAAFVSGIPLKAGLSGLAPGFRTYDDSFSWLERVHPMMTTLAAVRAANRVLPFDLVERRAEKTCAAAIRWLADAEPPRFLWVHVFDPHTPWDAPAVLRERFAQESPRWSVGGVPLTEWPFADYDAEIREADRGVEDLLRAFDEATGGTGPIVLTADHGEGLRQHGELTHGSQLYEEDLAVAWIARSPGMRPVPPASPTAGDRTRPMPLALTGVLLRELALGSGRIDPPGSPVVVCETFAPEGKRDQTAVIGREGKTTRKLILRRDTGEELAFDLTADPGETNPIEPIGPAWDRLRESRPGGRCRGNRSSIRKRFAVSVPSATLTRWR